MMAVPCPKCRADLVEFGEITLTDWVLPERDPEGKSRADLILECESCNTKFNAFVPLEDFQVIE
jgi:hypothetical protein